MSRPRRAEPTARTLLDVLRQRFPEAATNTLRQMLKTDRVTVNGAVERVAKRPIGPDDEVEVGGKRRLTDPRLSILFEDRDLIVVEKAAGLLSVPNPWERQDTAETVLDAYCGGRPGHPRIHAVHRLDRDTSGVLVFAKNEWMRDRLKELFEIHDIERLYVALVYGAIAPPAGTIRSFLSEDEQLRIHRVGDATQGREAVTHYRTVDSGRRYSRLEVNLETGRRHQVRVQLADAGHPVVGDPIYAEGRENPLGRLGLHARELGFVHPRTRERLRFTAPPPESFGRLAL